MAASSYPREEGLVKASSLVIFKWVIHWYKNPWFIVLKKSVGKFGDRDQVPCLVWMNLKKYDFIFRLNYLNCFKSMGLVSDASRFPSSTFTSISLSTSVVFNFDSFSAASRRTFSTRSAIFCLQPNYFIRPLLIGWVKKRCPIKVNFITDSPGSIQNKSISFNIDGLESWTLHKLFC